MYYTSYNGNSLREPMSARRLIPMLSAAAQEFQKKLGDKLKSKKLVK